MYDINKKYINIKLYIKFKVQHDENLNKWWIVLDTHINDINNKRGVYKQSFSPESIQIHMTLKENLYKPYNFFLYKISTY